MDKKARAKFASCNRTKYNLKRDLLIQLKKCKENLQRLMKEFKSRNNRSTLY